MRETHTILIRNGLPLSLSLWLHPELSWDEIQERLSSRTLDWTVHAPGCSRAVSKWISRSHECESTCIIGPRCDTLAERACTRDFLCKRACYPSERIVRWRPVRTLWFIVTLFTPICRFMAPPLGDGSAGHRGRSATPMPGETGISSGISSGESCPLSRPSLWVGRWNIHLTSVIVSCIHREVLNEILDKVPNSPVVISDRKI